MKQTNILVFGSYLVGLTMRVKQFPLAGETLLGYDYSAMHGGKGSNQAVACARLGARARFAGCVGDDAFGQGALALYREEGVDSSLTTVTRALPTGVGFILVNDQGENVITLDVGACKLVDAAFAERVRSEIACADMLLLQLEVPVEGVLRAAEIAHEAGRPALLNPAPYCALPRQIFKLLDVITPNQSEARRMLGLAPDDASLPPEQLARGILDLGIKRAVITLGGAGACFADAGGVRTQAAPRVTPVDTTGAGDTFTAALAVALCEGGSLEQAVGFAQRAAAISVTRYGVIGSLPRRSELA